MRVCHGITPVFDEDNLVSAAGLVPVMGLADRAGLTDLLEDHVSVPSAHAARKTRTLLAGMLAGADSIDGMNVLRSGGMTRLLGQVPAPSTLGTFLRSFTHGHVLQLAAVNRRLLGALTRQLPGMVHGEELLLVDLDDTMRELHGYRKQAVAYGYNKVKGLNAILATISGRRLAPVIGSFGLRRGNVRSGAKAGWHAARVLGVAREMAPRARVLLRADSAFCMHETIAPVLAAGGWFSITIPAWKNVTRVISEIPEEAWEGIEYPQAVFDADSGRWISDAEVAEIPFTAFTSRRVHEHVTCRLVVRRVRRLGVARPGQDPLFEAYRYHAFITNSDLPLIEADQRHRHHAIVEQTIAELKDGPLAHLPSGRFAANEAWLALSVLAFNISRAAAHATGRSRARMATIRQQVVQVPARSARRSRRLRLHLPRNWPWQEGWKRLWDLATGPPLPATT